MKLLEVIAIAVVVILFAHLALVRYAAPRRAPPADAARETNEPQPDLLDFVRGHLSEMERTRTGADTPKGSNYYGKFHDSDLHDERVDLSRFFLVEQSVPDTKKLLREITGDTCATPADCKAEMCTPLDPATGQPARVAEGSDGTPTLMPDVWSYANEKPMNGGKVDGVRAYDTLLSGHAAYSPSPQNNFGNSYPYLESAAQF